jgi:cyclophilin family peptidyl-prolyl cis-trans isomerase
VKITKIFSIILGLAILSSLSWSIYRHSSENKASPVVKNSANKELIEEKKGTEVKDSKVNEKLILDTDKDYQVTLKTDKGDLTIELNKNQTPKTVANFVNLSKEGFYDGTIFHRVIKGFMIQGGDPEGTGRGGPGYTFDDEPFEGEYTRGTVAMANSGPDTNGSQFFIMHQDYPLPKNYVIFGRLVEGFEVLDAIVNSEVESNSVGEKSVPVNPTKILSTEVVELE